MSQYKLGVAFAGGGVKCISQIALIELFEKQGVKPAFLAGTSAGALLAALYAIGLDSQEILHEIESALIEIEEKRVMKISGKDLLFNKELKHGLIDGARFESIINPILDKYGVKNIADVKIPLVITSVDLLSGDLILFVSHPHLYNSTHRRSKVVTDVPLIKALRATMSFPMVFGSMDLDGRALIDGGVRMNCPVPMLRDYGATSTMAVTLRSEVNGDASINKTLEVLSRVYDLMAREAEYRNAHDADFLLNIPVVIDSIFNFESGLSILQQGTDAIQKNESAILSFITPKQTLTNRILNYLRGNS